MRSRRLCILQQSFCLQVLIMHDCRCPQIIMMYGAYLGQADPSSSIPFSQVQPARIQELC